MTRPKAATAAQRFHSARFAAGLSLLVITAIGVLVWGNNIRNLTILGIAWVVIVGAAYLFAVKYLGKSITGKAGGGRDRAKGSLPL